MLNTGADTGAPCEDGSEEAVEPSVAMDRPAWSTLTPRASAEIEHLFQLYDADSSGRIDHAEFMSLCRSYNSDVDPEMVLQSYRSVADPELVSANREARDSLACARRAWIGTQCACGC